MKTEWLKDKTLCLQCLRDWTSCTQLTFPAAIRGKQAETVRMKHSIDKDGIMTNTPITGNIADCLSYDSDKPLKSDRPISKEDTDRS